MTRGSTMQGSIPRAFQVLASRLQGRQVEIEQESKGRSRRCSEV